MISRLPPIAVRHLGDVDYRKCWHEMQVFTDNRSPDTADELWFLQHPAVFTLGKNGKTEHVIDTGDIPVINSDRGGQVTYHGPGQLVAYTLIDIKRLNIGVRDLVTRLEQSVIGLLDEYNIEARARADAPGVYVKDAKIAALGLRVRKGCSFHGLALNVDVDLGPYSRINPCGFKAMKITRLTDLMSEVDMQDVESGLQRHLIKNLHDE